MFNEMYPNPADVTTFARIEELTTIEHAKVYVAKCERRRASLVALSNVPGKKAALKRWDEMIIAGKARIASFWEV